MNRQAPTLLLLGIIALSLTVAFVWLHLVTPSDGARLSATEPVYLAEGVAVTVYHDSASALRNGDVVTAVAGRSLLSWAQALFQGDVASRPAWQSGDTVLYEVVRDGEKMVVPVRLGRLPLGSIVAQRWGVLLFAFVSQLVAGFVFFKQPKEPAAQALFIWAISGSHSYVWSIHLQISDLVNGTGFWLYHLLTPGFWLIYWAAGLHVALVFPTRLPVVRRFPKLIPFLYALSFVLFSAYVAFQWPRSENVLLWLGEWSTANSLVAAIFLLTMVVVSVVQYRHNRVGPERDKIRWVIFATIVSGGGGLLLYIVAPFVVGRPLIGPNALGLLVLLFPLSLALAIWRHGLFDIDVIINRTLVYTVLTVALALVYFSSVALLQGFFQPFLGEESQITVVLSTLAIAALFNPLRQRIQRFIDRRFYRRKYDAEKTLAAFGRMIRDEVDLEQLAAELVRVVDETMQPVDVSLWLQAPKKHTVLGAMDEGPRNNSS